MARERNGSILMSKQVGCSSLSPLVNLSRYDWNLRMEERTWKIIAQKGLVDWRATGGVVTTLEKSWPLHRNVGGDRNYDCWLGRAAKFLLSENSDKTPLTELAKNQAFPLFMAACGWRRPGFFTPSVTFENRASRNPDVFLAGREKKLLPMCGHLVISWASYGYGSLWPHALCPTYLLYTNIFLQ